MAPLVFGLPQGSELIILLIVALLVFGGSKLAGLGKGAGRAIREFKEETRAIKDAESTRDTTVVAGDGPVEAELVEEPKKADPSDSR